MRYRAYGLSIGSSIRLPELLPGGREEPQVLIRRGSVTLPEGLERDRVGTAATERVAHLVWPGVGSFEVSEGREIVVDAVRGVAASTVRLFILGGVLGVLLHQRGYLVLHASAIAIEEKGVAILGAGGWGKSTTAAALHRRGHRVVADDVLAVDVASPMPLLFPGIPRLKLWPASAVAVGVEPASLPRVYDTEEKRTRRIVEGFQLAPLPLVRLYVLADGDVPACEQVAPQERFLNLLRHSYMDRLVRSTGAGPLHLRQCSRLLERVPMRRLTRPWSLGGLDALAQVIEADVAGVHSNYV